MDWNGDHPHTNFRSLFGALRAAGFFVELLGGNLSSFAAAEYAALCTRPGLGAAEALALVEWLEVGVARWFRRPRGRLVCPGAVAAQEEHVEVVRAWRVR